MKHSAEIFFTRKTRKYIGYSLLLFFALLGLYLLTSFANYSSVPFFSSSDKTTLFIELPYPPISNGNVPDIILNASFNVISNETIAEKVNMTLANPRVVLYGGTPRNEYIIHNISWISIAYQNAHPMRMAKCYWTDPSRNNTISPYKSAYYNEPSGAVFLINKNDLNHPIFSGNHNHTLNLSQNSPFYFSVSGDYSPIILLAFKNGSLESHTYDEIKIHVPSTSELHTQAISKINCFIALALFFFGLFTLTNLVHAWIDKAPENSSGDIDLIFRL